MTDRSPLVGTVAVVAGGAGDIGHAIGRTLAERGAKVLLADVDEARANDLAAALCGEGLIAHATGVDLSRESAAGELIEHAATVLGPVTTVVNAAAVTQRGRIDTLPDSAWPRLLAVNLSAVFWCCKAAIRHMLDTDDGGVIINIGSIAGVRGLAGSPAYAATKGGVVALSRALAIDHARDGIRVHVINPPPVDTRLYRRMFEPEDDPEAARHEFEAGEGAGRVLTVDEIAALAVFLAERKGPVFSPEPLVW